MINLIEIYMKWVGVNEEDMGDLVDIKDYGSRPQIVGKEDGEEK